ncbi:MAG: short-chain fatty acid transporter [Flavobacteriia bacterium]|nr:short-chain fatty acid transporter [Flavobacteriia bacterium]
MSNFTERFENTFRRLLPSPLAIAFILTAIAFLCAIVFTKPEAVSIGGYAIDLGLIWKDGLWQSGLLAFTVQMMLILVLGHILALSPFVTKLIDKLVGGLKNGTQAAVVVGIATMMVALFNWGLGLIFGAIFARKVAEMAHRKNMAISYPLIGAAGYSGLMVWHGGLSGSAPIKANQEGHIAELLPALPSEITHRVSMQDTVFSSMNAFATVAILTAVGLTLWILSKRVKTAVPASFARNVHTEMESGTAIGAEKIDRSNWLGIGLGIIFILLSIYSAVTATQFFDVITPDYINFLFLGLALLFHRSLVSFGKALDEAISGASGILIQFPLYFGIMALVRDSGLLDQIANTMIAHSTETSLPITTFFSAGLVNIFVPSGGGQWAIQGPLILQAATDLHLSFGKAIMALAYGDQITNMLQPFWALPLLAITKLKARDILPYTLILMLVGIVAYVTTLLIF